MKTNNRKGKILLGVSMIGLLAISYWLITYVLFEIHGMKDWPRFLAIISLIIMIIGFMKNRQVISIMTIIAYIGGFIFVMIFNTEGLDQGGGRINNAWTIWLISFVGLIC